jgi:hypothetical protein
MATHQIPCTNLRKNKILAGSFKQVAGETGLAPLDLIPSKSALPVSFGQIYTYSYFIWVPKRTTQIASYWWLYQTQPSVLYHKTERQMFRSNGAQWRALLSWMLMRERDDGQAASSNTSQQLPNPFIQHEYNLERGSGPPLQTIVN